MCISSHHTTLSRRAERSAEHNQARSVCASVHSPNPMPTHTAAPRVRETMSHGLWRMCLLLLLAGCQDEGRRALGTLEMQRVTVPAPQHERITAIDVSVGDRVPAGAVLLQLDDTLARLQLAADEAEVLRVRTQWQESVNGPRPEELRRAEALVEAQQATLDELQLEIRRSQDLVKRQLSPQAELDRLQASLKTARANLHAAEAEWLLLQRGTRTEQVQQLAAALQAAQARRDISQVNLERLRITAPQKALVEALPLQLGDKPMVGQTLVVLLLEQTVHARVYVPGDVRARLQVGSAARIHIESQANSWPGHVRLIESQARFTPYFALSGDDAAGLSYLAEITFDEPPDPALLGQPVQVEFDWPQDE